MVDSWRMLNLTTHEDKELFRARLVDPVSVDPTQK